MDTLRPSGLACLVRESVLAATAAASLFGAVVQPLPVLAGELAMREVPAPSRIVLDLRKRQITVLRGQQRLGPWPVAIGDPKLPRRRENSKFSTRR